MMNHSTPHDDTLDSRETNETNDAALEQRLHAYFAARADSTPAIDPLWGRLASQLDERTPMKQAATRAGNVAVAPVSQPLDDGADDKQPDMQPTPIQAPHLKRLGHSQRSTSRFARIASSVATLAAVLFVTLGAVALFRWQSDMNRTTGNVIRSGQLTWRKITLPPGVKLSEDISVTYNNLSATATNVALSSPTIVSLTPLPNTSLYVAQSDGDTAYICQTTISTERVSFWRTRDGGRHWTRLPTLTRVAVLGCSITIDKNNPLNVVATIYHGVVQARSRIRQQYTVRISPSHAGATVSTLHQEDVSATLENDNAMYALFAGSSRWQTIGVMPGDRLDGLVSAGNRYYALWATVANSKQYMPTDSLFESTDQMRSWHEVDKGIIPAPPASITEGGATIIRSGDGVQSIWAQPTSNGEMLALTYSGRLWISADQGAHWSRISYPAIPPASQLPTPPGANINLGEPIDGLVWVAQPTIGQTPHHCAQVPHSSSSLCDHTAVVGQPFHICALVLHDEPITFNSAPMYCSTDSGQHWTRRPQPTAGKTPRGGPQFEMPVVLLANGALIAWDVHLIFLLPGDDTAIHSGTLLGTIPSPVNENSIPAGGLGVTTTGATFWQQHDGQTVYVSQYRL